MKAYQLLCPSLSAEIAPLLSPFRLFFSAIPCLDDAPYHLVLQQYRWTVLPDVLRLLRRPDDGARHLPRAINPIPAFAATLPRTTSYPPVTAADGLRTYGLANPLRAYDFASLWPTLTPTLITSCAHFTVLRPFARGRAYTLRTHIALPSLHPLAQPVQPTVYHPRCKVLTSESFCSSAVEIARGARTAYIDADIAHLLCARTTPRAPLLWRYLMTPSFLRAAVSTLESCRRLGNGPRRVASPSALLPVPHRALL